MHCGLSVCQSAFGILASCRHNISVLLVCQLAHFQRFFDVTEICLVSLVCGLLATCILVFIAYRYLLSSSSEEKVEYQEQQVEYRQQKVEGKQAAMSTWKVADTSSIPGAVLSKVDTVTVEEKTATFNVDGHVSHNQYILWLESFSQATFVTQ